MMQRFVGRRACAALPVASSQLFGAQRLKVENFSGSHDDFKKTVSSGVTVAKMSADWCGPCKACAPAVEQLSEKYTDVKFLHIDVEENEDIGAMLNVRSIPYFVLFKDGKVAGTVEGANMDKLSELVESSKK